MIHEIGEELAEILHDRKCPFPVYDGPAGGETSWGTEAIYISHDDDRGDGFAPITSQSRGDQKRRLIRRVAGKITIVAQKGAAGANEFEHRRRAEQVLDMVLIAMSEIAETRKQPWQPTGGRFIQPVDLEKSEVPAGAVYELAFTIDRGVAEKTWKGESRPTTVLQVSMTGNPSLTFEEVGATGDTITRSAGSWIADGFEVGMTVKVRGTDSNNVTGEIAALTATVLTFGTTDLVNEGPVSDCWITSGGIQSTTKVSLKGGPDDDDNLLTVPAAAETACGD